MFPCFLLITTDWLKMADYDVIAGRFELKGKQLHAYMLPLTAESTSLDYFIWVNMLDIYFERQDLDPYEKMSMARTALIGDIQHWWSNLEYHFMYTWEQMKKKLQRRFVPPPPTVTSEVQPKVTKNADIVLAPTPSPNTAETLEEMNDNLVHPKSLEEKFEVPTVSDKDDNDKDIDLVLQQDIEPHCEYIPTVVQSCDFSYVDLNKPCAALKSHNCAHVELITHKEVLDRISPADTLCYIMLNEPISLECAREKVFELSSLNSFSSTSTYYFKLIGDYGIDNQFLVYRICITCTHMDELKLVILDNNSCVLNLVQSERKIKFSAYPMPMCSPYIAPSSMDSLNKNVELWKSLHFFSPLLDEFAIARLKSDYMDECCLIPKVVCLPICATTASLQFQRFELHKCFTYICKTSCNNCCVRNFILIIHIYDYSWMNNTMIFYDRCCLLTLIVQQRRSVKTDDIDIYHAYTLASLLPYFQLIKSRGRLCFQEREDDEDMTPIDTTIFAIFTVPNTRARTLHLNYQVSLFLGVSLYYMNYMMLPNDEIYICAAPCHFWSKTSRQFERDPFWNPVRPPESA